MKNKFLFSHFLFPFNLLILLSYTSSSSQKVGAQKKENNGLFDVEAQPIKFDPGCDSSIWNYVYNPKRLKVIDRCKVVTGVIVERNAEDDGDEHMLLRLDKGLESLLTKRNFQKKDGNLVIEAICINHITRKNAKGTCNGYVNNVQLPKVGDHVRVTGIYVIDSHNGWSEIHPVTKIEDLK
ncbi:MAG: hypothetical protein M3O67_03650 [Bacteroidota bacterium]|nr:hypothetical protein [Bacteroidota bacterium]